MTLVRSARKYGRSSGVIPDYKRRDKEEGERKEHQGGRKNIIQGTFGPTIESRLLPRSRGLLDVISPARTSSLFFKQWIVLGIFRAGPPVTNMNW